MLTVWIILCSVGLVGAVLFWGDCDGGTAPIFNNGSPGFEDGFDDDCCCCAKCEWCINERLPPYGTVVLSGVAQGIATPTNCCLDFNTEFELECEPPGAGAGGCKYNTAISICNNAYVLLEYYVRELGLYDYRDGNGEIATDGPVVVARNTVGNKYGKMGHDQTYDMDCEADQTSMPRIDQSWYFSEIAQACKFENCLASWYPRCEETPP